MKKKYEFKEGIPIVFRIRATAICERFFIEGLCDPMYIVNSIAKDTGYGDGCGNFTDTALKLLKLSEEEAEKCADFLLNAYASNIPKGSRDELVYILQFGYIPAAKAKEGIRRYFQRLKNEERRAEAIGDLWRANYSRKCQKLVLKSNLTKAIIPYAWEDCQVVFVNRGCF